MALGLTPLPSYTSACNSKREAKGFVPVDPMTGEPGPMRVSEPARTAVNRSITVTAASQTLMVANATRHKFVIKNDDLVDVWINLIGAATANAGAGNIKVATGGYFEMQGFVGTVTVACASGTTAAITAYEF